MYCAFFRIKGYHESAARYLAYVYISIEIVVSLKKDAITDMGRYNWVQHYQTSMLSWTDIWSGELRLEIVSTCTRNTKRTYESTCGKVVTCCITSLWSCCNPSGAGDMASGWRYMCSPLLSLFVPTMVHEVRFHKVYDSFLGVSGVGHECTFPHFWINRPENKSDISPSGKYKNPCQILCKPFLRKMEPGLVPQDFQSKH